MILRFLNYPSFPPQTHYLSQYHRRRVIFMLVVLGPSAAVTLGATGMVSRPVPALSQEREYTLTSVRLDHGYRELFCDLKSYVLGSAFWYGKFYLTFLWNKKIKGQS